MRDGLQKAKVLGESPDPMVKAVLLQGVGSSACHPEQNSGKSSPITEVGHLGLPCKKWEVPVAFSEANIQYI